MTDGQPTDEAEFGAQLRALRHARGLSLQELSDISGLSIGAISQVERGLTNPSIKSLQNLAHALGVTVGWLFHHGNNPSKRDRGIVVRNAQRRRTELEGGQIKELLTPNLTGALEMLIVTIPKGGSSGDGPYTHAGEEAGLILEGTLDLWVDGEHYGLSEGDSFGFASTRPHQFSNPGDVITRVLWVITPPTF